MPAHTDPAIRRLVDATLMPSFAGTAVPDWLARRIEGSLGSVCLFAHNLTDGVAQVTGRLHALRPELLVASDEEGGEVTRIEAATGSSWPGHAALGNLDELEVTQQVARAIGRQARAAGVDLVLAPVVDVNSNPDNPVIGLRSFGTDTELVCRHASAFVEGLQSAGVAGCAKHFPGHGDTRTDSHVGLPFVDVDLATLRRRDLPPFAAAARAGVRAMMTAHVVVPAIDRVPATLSGPVLRIAREELGFQGVVVSDALDMRAISAGVGRARGAVLALQAGVDLVAIGNPRFPERYDAQGVFEQIRAAILDAVDSGELGSARLEDAARRVAELARWVGQQGQAGEALGEERGEMDPSADRAAARSAMRRVVESSGAVALTGRAHVIDLRGRPNMAAGRRPSGLVDALAHRVPALECHEVSAVAEPCYALTKALSRAGSASLVVVVEAPQRRPTEQRLLDMVLHDRPDAVVVMTGLPDKRARLGPNWVHTWGDGRAAGEAAAEVLLARPLTAEDAG